MDTNQHCDVHMVHEWFHATEVWTLPVEVHASLDAYLIVPSPIVTLHTEDRVGGLDLKDLVDMCRCFELEDTNIE